MALQIIGFKQTNLKEETTESDQVSKLENIVENIVENIESTGLKDTIGFKSSFDKISLLKDGLLEKIDNINEEGIWEISRHSEGNTGNTSGFYNTGSVMYRGKYKDVVDYAFLLDGFVAHSQAGSIKKVNVLDIDEKSVYELKMLKEKELKLKEELGSIRSKIYAYK